MCVFIVNTTFIIIIKAHSYTQQVVSAPRQGRGRGVSEEGKVSPRTPDTPVNAGKEEEESDVCFLLDGGWSCRLNVPAGGDFD